MGDDVSLYNGLAIHRLRKFHNFEERHTTRFGWPTLQRALDEEPLRLAKQTCSSCVQPECDSERSLDKGAGLPL